MERPSGEAESDRASLLRVLANLPEHPESVPINALVPVKGTPLEGLTPPGGLEMVRTLVPIRPRWRGERRSLRTFAVVSLRPSLAFNPRPRRLSTSTDAFQLHPDSRENRVVARVRRRRRARVD